MKKLFAILAVMGVLSFGMTQSDCTGRSCSN